MSIRIAIPEPASPQYVDDALAYNQRSLPQYIAALQSAGATPILIPLHETPSRVAKILTTTVGILLPGSGADLDPQKYGEPRSPHSAAPDPARAAADELLIQDAFNLHKPILAICAGAQSLNVWCGGSLIQDIPTQIGTAVNHAPARTVIDAHPIELTPNTRLSEIARHIPIHEDTHPERSFVRHPQHNAASHLSHLKPAIHEHESPAHLLVNSSHHQSIRIPGDNLIISARCPQDGIIEAAELRSPDHFALAIQWHPERTYIESAFSRAIFAAFAQAAESWTPRKIAESVLQS
ncbi:gamma-glutamyl-gamma-aminobutyrate hydrolase family protein [Acidicapsa ligni]|uniref:gamma-glutamyl-gamma-aminobutyrate hydrolase family protein n=1 Tax=Acidicapsa ligni TaxID=542300 RepID=UPI0021DFA07A|nr:gamma-glutamyl-gamma-aminobutyrate hydrolase family protein [Acidicapsa ligni]